MRGLADERDAEIVARRMAQLDERTTPRVGDFMRFSDGTVRRISYIWPGDEDEPAGAQTTDGTGSFHLGDHGCGYSGALHPPVSVDKLTLTDERRDGAVWIFHHDFPGAGRGVTFRVPFRVYDYPGEPTSG